MGPKWLFRTGQFQKIRHLYSFSLGSFLCFGSREAVRKPTEIKHLCMSPFPAFLLGAHKSVLEPTQKPPQNIARTSPGTSPEPLQSFSKPTPNWFQTEPRPIPNRPQTNPKPLLILGAGTLHDLNLAYLILLNSIDRCDIDILSILWIQYPYNIDTVPILYIQSRYRVGTVLMLYRCSIDAVSVQHQ